MKNTLAYCGAELFTIIKRFIVLPPSDIFVSEKKKMAFILMDHFL
jgi:hypothetical protein